MSSLIEVDNISKQCRVSRSILLLHQCGSFKFETMDRSDRRFQLFNEDGSMNSVVAKTQLSKISDQNIDQTLHPVASCFSFKRRRQTN